MEAAGEGSGLLLPPFVLAGSYPLINASYLQPPASAISASGQ